MITIRDINKKFWKQAVQLFSAWWVFMQSGSVQADLGELFSPSGSVGEGFSDKNWVVQSASQKPYPIYDQNLWFSIPYLWPDPKSKPCFRLALCLIS